MSLTCIISGNFWKSHITASVVLIIVSYLNYYVCNVRGAEITPADVRAWQTALTVAGNYSIIITLNLVVGVFLTLVLFTCCSHFFKMKESHFWRIIAVFVLLISMFGISLLKQNVPQLVWADEGARKNTFIVNFYECWRNSIVRQPDGYDPQVLQSLVEIDEKIDEDKVLPNIIIIMNESFSDLNVVGEFETNVPVLEYYNSLTQNTIKGNALVSTFGAGTANSEWECLTGYSMNFIQRGVTPFQDTGSTTSDVSIVSHLEEYGYRTIAMHPFNSTGYGRSSMYPLLGFDEMMFKDCFPDSRMIRNYISDQSTYEKIIDLITAEKDNLFIHCVTIQNHGGYEYSGDNYSKTVELNGLSQEYPKAEQYLSILRESDLALEYLIETLKEISEPTVVLFFGDHLPSVEEEFYQEIGQGKSENEYRIAMYTVPFFVWTNYDSTEESQVLTSLNYLSNYLYEAAGIPKPLYNQFLDAIQEVIPAMNHECFYSKSKKAFVSYDQTDETENKYLKEYENLVYNAVYDKNNRSPIFIKEKTQ